MTSPANVAVVLTCMLVAARAFLARIEQCEPIEITRCRAMPYNMTQMPNLLHHGTQENARLVFEKFEVLLDQRCSDVLLFLLCSLHVPICAVSLQPEAIPPCRSVCEKARAGCEPLMNSYNVSWPDTLECSRLPRYERGVCVSPEAFVKPTQKKKGCKACKKKKPTLAHMRKYKYDYAIKAHVLKGKRVGSSEIIYRVKVAEVAFSEKVKFKANDEVTMWVNSTCPCPKLHKGRDYLVMGLGDGLSSKLMLTPASVVAKWRDPLSTKLKKWQQRLKAHNSKPADKTKNTDGGGDRGKKRRKGGAMLSPGGNSRENAGPQGVPVKQNKPKSPSSMSDFVNGYTHGGRYYTKELAKKYNQAALRGASD